MSKRAVERVVERLMKDPQVKASGTTEMDTRSRVARVAERADRMYGPPEKPLSKKEHERRADNVRPNLIRTRAPIDKDSKIHYDLAHADGTAPPRAAFHQRVTEQDRKEMGEFGRRLEARLKERLTRG